MKQFAFVIWQALNYVGTVLVCVFYNRRNTAGESSMWCMLPVVSGQAVVYGRGGLFLMR